MTGSESTISGFSASGILGSRHYHLRLDGPASIIVGPNGTGKSTFLSLFYLMLSRQWARLNEYEFSELVLHHSGGSITLNKADLLEFDITGKHGGAERYIARLRAENALDLLYKPSLSKEDRERMAHAAAIPVERVTTFRRYVQTEFGFTKRGYEIDQEIAALKVGPILYLPTYRRIEKDIKSIFPDIESRLRARIEESQVGPRSGSGFREIASFGMGDITALIERYTSDVKEYQRQASETASQEYIRDIVRGRIKNYSLSNLRKMDDSDFEDFKVRLDEKLFSESDRESLRAKIDDLRRRQHGQPTAESRFLGMFVEKLLAAHQRVKERERPLKTFVDTVSKYLKPDKRLALRESSVVVESISDVDPEGGISLEKLSSGEKQIVSIFAYLFLSGQKDFIVFIDEPELSLSVAWQKRFLPDVVGSGSCARLITVTHSPYVFDNELQSSVIDVRRLRVSDVG